MSKLKYILRSLLLTSILSVELPIGERREEKLETNKQIYTIPYTKATVTSTYLVFETTPSVDANFAFLYVSQTNQEPTPEDSSYQSILYGKNKKFVLSSELEDKEIYMSVNCEGNCDYSVIVYESNEYSIVGDEIIEMKLNKAEPYEIVFKPEETETHSKIMFSFDSIVNDLAITCENVETAEKKESTKGISHLSGCAFDFTKTSTIKLTITPSTEVESLITITSRYLDGVSQASMIEYQRLFIDTKISKGICMALTKISPDQQLNFDFINMSHRFEYTLQKMSTGSVIHQGIINEMYGMSVQFDTNKLIEETDLAFCFNLIEEGIENLFVLFNIIIQEKSEQYYKYRGRQEVGKLYLRTV